MSTPELNRILRQVLPNTDPCDSAAELTRRARDEMTYYLKLVHLRLTNADGLAVSVQTKKSRVEKLLADIDSACASAHPAQVKQTESSPPAQHTQPHTARAP